MGRREPHTNILYRYIAFTDMTTDLHGVVIESPRELVKVARASSVLGFHHVWETP